MRAPRAHLFSSGFFFKFKTSTSTLSPLQILLDNPPDSCEGDLQLPRNRWQRPGIGIVDENFAPCLSNVISPKNFVDSKKYFCQSRWIQVGYHEKLTNLAMTTFCIFRKNDQVQKYFRQSRWIQVGYHEKLTNLAMTTFCIFRKNDQVQKYFRQSRWIQVGYHEKLILLTPHFDAQIPSKDDLSEIFRPDNQFWRWAQTAARTSELITPGMISWSRSNEEKIFLKLFRIKFQRVRRSF